MYLISNLIELIVSFNKGIIINKVNWNNSYMYVCMYINIGLIYIYLLCMINVRTLGIGGVLVVCGECYNLG